MIRPATDDATLLSLNTADAPVPEPPTTRFSERKKRTLSRAPPPGLVSDTESDDETDEMVVREQSPRKRAAVQFAAPLTPPAAATPTKPATREGLIEEQQTRRSEGRVLHEQLQRGEIPFYDAEQNDAARTVVIDRPTFESFREDTAFEFQDANRMPWAPSLPPNMMNKIRTWQLLETLTELDQRTKPWYTMVSLVAGFLKTDVDQLVVPAPSTASVAAARPTRSNVLGSAFADTGASQVGLTGGAASIGLSKKQTPFRFDFEEGEFDAAKGPFEPGGGLADDDDDNEAPAQRKKRRDRERARFAPDGPAAGGGGAPEKEAPEQPLGASTRVDRLAMKDVDDGAPKAPPVARDGDAPLTGAEVSRLMIDRAIETEGTRVRSRARFAELRNDRRDVAWYEVSKDPKTLALNQELRAAGAQAQQWITRPVATGIYYLNNNYVAARDEAFTLITSSADHLANVPIEAFIADDQRDSVQIRVRTLFAKLIATLFNFHRHNTSRFTKLAQDAANLTAQSHEVVRHFATRITYDPLRRRFLDTGAAGATNRQHPWERRPLGVPRMPAALPYTAANNPLLFRAPGGPLAWAPRAPQ